MNNKLHLFTTTAILFANMHETSLLKFCIVCAKTHKLELFVIRPLILMARDLLDHHRDIGSQCVSLL